MITEIIFIMTFQNYDNKLSRRQKHNSLEFYVGEKLG